MLAAFLLHYSMLQWVRRRVVIWNEHLLFQHGNMIWRKPRRTIRTDALEVIDEAFVQSRPGLFFEAIHRNTANLIRCSALNLAKQISPRPFQLRMCRKYIEPLQLART